MKLTIEKIEAKIRRYSKAIDRFSERYVYSSYLKRVYSEFEIADRLGAKHFNAYSFVRSCELEELRQIDSMALNNLLYKLMSYLPWWQEEIRELSKRVKES